LPYGDQGIFVRRGVLAAMGGVADVPILEDLDLVRGIRAQGRLVLLDLPATTSGRRYAKGRGLRTIWLHQWALIGWWLGFDRARLARRLGR
ncbi:glycosyltransferase, partial [Myxococcota bacterium]|nr:glycosyltransferase [Myxococcota bacterium]